MGFKILLRAAPGEFVSAVSNVFEEQPLTLDAQVDLDWSDEAAVRRYFRQKVPSVVVNYGSHLSSVDFEHEYTCLQILTALCRETDTPFLHFSSYRAFGDGPGGGRLDEALVPAPSDPCGKRLLEYESLGQSLSRHLVLRLSWVFGGEEDNVLSVLVDKLLKGESISVSDHDYGRPVNLQFVANIVLTVVQQVLCGAENWGVFHVHAADKCSEAELCDVVVRLINSEIKEKVNMPAVAGVDDNRRLLAGNAMLMGRRCTDNFGIQWPSWRKGLKGQINTLLTRAGQVS